MTAALVLAFVPVALLLTMTPGTDTLLVLRTAGMVGRGAAMRASLGIALGCLIWGAAVAVGLGALIVASPAAFAALRVAGAIYLAWIGITLILARAEPAAETTAPAARLAFRRGLVTNLVNPKIGVFYLTLLPQFLPQGAGWSAGLVLAGVHVALTLLWFAALIGATRIIAPWLSRAAVRRAMDRVSGAIFIGFGAKLALT